MPALNLTTADIQAAGAPPPGPTPTPEPTASAPAAPEGGAKLQANPAAMLELLPSDVLDNPVIFALAKGKPGAVSAPKKSKDPIVQSVIKNAEPLVAAGFGIYESIDKKTDVLFNTKSIDAGDLQEADQQGRLMDVAPPFNTVSGSAPAGAGAPAAGGAPAPSALPPASAPESQPAPSVQNKLASERTKNLQPSGPTGGPAPGAGNILNAILKRPV